MGRATERLPDLPRSLGLTHGWKMRSQKPKLPPSEKKIETIQRDFHMKKAGMAGFINNNNILAILITDCN